MVDTSSNGLLVGDHVIIVQQLEEIELISNRFGRSAFARAKNVIAWTPFAVDGLRNNQIAYTTAGDVFTKKFDYEKKERFLLEYVRWCWRLDKIINDNIDLVDRQEFKPFLNQCLHKRHHVMNIATELDCLISLRDIVGSSKVVFVYYGVDSFSPLSRAVDMLESQPNWQGFFFKVNSRDLELQDKNSRFWFRQFLSNFDLYGKTKTTVVYNWLRSKGSDVLHRRRSNRKLRSLLCGLGLTSLSYDQVNVLVFCSTEEEVEPLLRSLNRIVPQLNLVYWDQCIVLDDIEDLKIDTREILNQLDNEPEITSSFHWDGISLYDELKPEIERIIRDDINILYRNMRYFQSLHEKYNFRLVISSGTYSIQDAIFLYCERLGIPRLCMPHGGTLGVFKGRPDRLQYARPGGKEQYEFHYTEVIKTIEEKYIEKYATQSKPIVIGSSYFTTMRRRLGKGTGNRGNIVRACYVTSMISGVIDLKHGTASSASAYQLLFDVVSRLSGSSAVELTVKMGYGIEALQLDVTKCFPNVKFVSSSRKFSSIIREFDIFILPWLSTPFFEVVCGTQAILMFCDLRYEVLTEKAESCIRRGATLVKEKTEFFEKIDDLAEHGKQSSLLRHGAMDRKGFIENYIGVSKTSPAELGARWIEKNVINRHY